MTVCPNCGKAIIELEGITNDPIANVGFQKHIDETVYPRTRSGKKLPPEVPDDFAKDYYEAADVLTISPKASAALSRRLLQRLLREVAGVTPQDLFKEIKQVLDSRVLPSHLNEGLSLVRNIGNFAAHPIESTNSGQILEVVPKEAEWSIDILYYLFDFYFVRPVNDKKMQDEFNQKLAEAGKPPIK